MAKIQQKFNFSPFTGEALPGVGQNHVSSSSMENIVSPYIFNEYERVMSLIIDTLGDVDYATVFGTDLGVYGGVPLTPSTTPQTTGEAINELVFAIRTLYEGKIGVSGGTINGSLSISGTTNGYVLSITGKTTANGIILPWSVSTLYPEGMLVQYEGIIYQCISEHTSSSFYSDIGYWKPISETGGSRFVITLPPGSSEFDVGDVLTYRATEGYGGAVSTDLDNAPLVVVVKKLSSSVYLVATTGIVEFESDIFSSPGSIYYLSPTLPGKVTTIKPHSAKPIYIAVTSNKAVLMLGQYRLGTYIELETFVVTELDENEFQLRFAPENENFVFVAINGMLQQPNVYTVSETGLLTIVLDEGEHLYPGDAITVRYFYGDELTTVTLQMSGYTVGNDAGNVPLSNSARNVSLNADLLDNYHARNESCSIPISNGILNVALHADMLDGAHLSTDTSLLPGTDEYIPTQNAVRNAIATSIATFYHTYTAVDTAGGMVPRRVGYH